MSPPVFFLLITLILVVGGLVRSAMRHRLTTHSRIGHTETDELRDEVRHMRERIAVLERVITDNHGSIDLDRQIERLRDR